MATPAANIQELRNPPARMPANTSPGFADQQSFELLQRGAKLLAASPLVPEIYRGTEGFPSCVIALNMALRMQADPLMVMQNLYVVHGSPSWSAQFLIACFNQCGRFSALRYRWQGKECDDSWGCRAWATELATGQEIVGPLVTMATAKAEGWINRSGSKWKTIPELMLTYRSAAWMIRTHAPELAMGLPTAEESGDVYDVTAEGVTLDSLKPAAPQASDSPPLQDAGGQQSPRTPDAPDDQERPTQTPKEKPARVDKGTGELLEQTATFASVDMSIDAAISLDELNLARDLIRSVPDPAHQATLRKNAEKRERELRT